jgi:hypothetical protein
MPNHTQLAAMVERLEAAIDQLPQKDQSFGRSLCTSYHDRGLTDKQQFWVGKLLERIGEYHEGTASSQPEQVFNGQAIRNLLQHAAEKLRYPKLRYKTDGGSRVVLGYASEGKWTGCVFITNGASAQTGGKKRYGFISKFGNGKLDYSSPPDVKKLILQIAENPTVEAIHQGKKHFNCCFCGLDLTNKSSQHYGYGPICAGKYGLPWGDTGDSTDEEAAALAELEQEVEQDGGEFE